MLPPNVQIPLGALPVVVHIGKPRRYHREVRFVVLLALIPLHRHRLAGVERAAPEREGRAREAEASPDEASRLRRRRKPRREAEAVALHEVDGVRHCRAHCWAGRCFRSGPREAKIGWGRWEKVGEWGRFEIRRKSLEADPKQTSKTSDSLSK